MPMPKDIIRLATAAAPEIMADDSRTVRFVLSDASVARDNHTIATDGWDTTNYLNNPVVLFGHDASSVESVIGRMASISRRGGQLVGDIEFMPGDINPMAETVYQMVKGGYLNAVSVGFIPLDGQPAKGRGPGAYNFTRTELLEVSVVPVPALPSALAEARAAGIDTAPALAWAKRLLEMDMPKPKIIKRDLSDCGWLAMLLQSLACLEEDAEYESEVEGDNSPVPAMLADAIKTLGGILIAMTAEEVAELIGEEVGERATDTAGQRAVKALGRAIKSRAASPASPDISALVRAAVADAFAAHTRAGRVLSSGNEASLRDAHEHMRQAVEAVSGVLDQLPDTGEDGDGGTETRAVTEARNSDAAAIQAARAKRERKMKAAQARAAAAVQRRH